MFSDPISVFSILQGKTKKIGMCFLRPKLGEKFFHTVSEFFRVVFLLGEDGSVRIEVTSSAVA